MIKRFTQPIKKVFKSGSKDDFYHDILLKNEAKADLVISRVLLACAIIILPIVFLIVILQECLPDKNFEWLFVNYENQTFVLSVFFGAIAFTVPRILCKFLHRCTWIIKYISAIILTLFSFALLQFSPEISLLYAVLPVVASTVYAQKKFTIKVSVLTTLLFAGEFFKGLNAIFTTDFSDGTQLIMQATCYESYMLLMKLLIYFFISFVCVHIAGQIRNMVIEQNNAYVAHMANEKISADINFAHTIQQSILPLSDSLSAYSDKFSIDASMNPADGVGGDLYDFFMIDETHVAFIVADVSGKGLPAAMFMMSAKSIIKGATMLKNNPGDILTTVNSRLCEHNESRLFITAWLGILDTKTGKLVYSNAGHNPPLLCQNGSFEYLNSKPGLVLALMDSMKYTQNEITLQPGDMIYLYTDGVTEAINPKEEEYGEERLKSYLNSHKTEDLSDIINGIKSDVDTFSDGEKQFDDMTMLILKFNNVQKEDYMNNYFFPAEMDSLEKVREVVLKTATENNVPEEICDLVFIAIEEIFVNIVRYAYQNESEKEKCTFEFNCTVENNTIAVSFIDKGIQFNPMNQSDPDITADADSRQIGGLGIFMTKKLMDEVIYKYKDDKNCLTLVKSF